MRQRVTAAVQSLFAMARVTSAPIAAIRWDAADRGVKTSPPGICQPGEHIPQESTGHQVSVHPERTPMIQGIVNDNHLRHVLVGEWMDLLAKVG